MNDSLYHDPVVADIHAVRAEMLASCGGDAGRLMREVRARQANSPRELISAPLRRRTVRAARDESTPRPRTGSVPA